MRFEDSKSEDRDRVQYTEEDEEEEEEEDGNVAVSGKLAIHLDTGETSREERINRLDDTRQINK